MEVSPDRSKDRNVSPDDFKALEETAYLLRTPTNARRLMDAIDSLNTGGGQEHDLP